MKQVLEDLRTGRCYVDQIPAPAVRPGTVLVRTSHSLISTGTEGGTVALGRMSLLGKARARPEQARKVIQLARAQGPLTAYQVAMRALDMPVALGYCCTGVVLEVGEGVDDLRPGMRVACGGQGHANHAEVVCVPRNLCVVVPDGAAPRHAAFTTMGAIALQGLRVADCRLGETVVVIGLGLLGLITVQLLRAAGCRVFGIDVDPARIDFVTEHHMCQAALAGDANLAEQVTAASGGIGADAVIITAASEDNRPVALAGELARMKGRVVVLGRTDLRAPRETFLFKELELRTSLAYGPGTGDPSYELDGLDYPVAYVRWTEARNMQAFVEALAAGRLDLEPLVSHEFEVDRAGEAFELISTPGRRSTAVLLSYPGPAAADLIRTRTLATASRRRVGGARLGVGVIGAGSYATNEFLPLLAARDDVELRVIASASGVRAKALGDTYGFARCASEAEAVLEDSRTDCVFILTRHDSHAPLTVQALEAGRHVFVEKPLGLDHAQLDAVEAALHRSGGGLMVGFNRRYAALAVAMKEAFGRRAQPLAVQYRASVGYRPPEHWLHHPTEGGGVVVGEACHHIDFCAWLVGEPVSDVQVLPLGSTRGGVLPEDNVHIALRFADGSIANVAYLSNGGKGLGSERVEAHGDNRSAALEDFRRLTVAGAVDAKTRRLWLTSDKGHAAQIAAFLRTAAEGGEWSTASYLASSRVAVDAAALAAGGATRSGATAPRAALAEPIPSQAAGAAPVTAAESTSPVADAGTRLEAS